MSKDRTGEELGIQRQHEDIKTLAQQRGLTLRERFIDNDISATRARHRPGYTALMAAVDCGKVDAILVWSLSRLWRNRAERAVGIEKLRKHGVSVLCCKGPDLNLSTAAGRLLAGLLGEVDTHEVEQKSEREQRAMRQRVEQGKAPGGPRTFGYTADGRSLDDTEAPEVGAAFASLLAGASVSGIARELNSRDILNRNGKPWSHNSVRGMLLNERYAGLREYRGELYTGQWPAIVGEDTWRAAVAILTDDARKTSPGPARRWLLSGIARCGVCDNDTTVTSGYRDGGERVYRCRDTKHMARLAEPIDFLVEEYAAVRLSRPDAIELLVDADRPDAEDLQANAVALRGRIKALAEEFAEDDDAEPAEFRTATRLLKKRLAALEARMAHPQRARILADIITAEDPATAWYALPLDRKRAALDVLATVTILRGKSGRRPFDASTVRIEPRKHGQE